MQDEQEPRADAPAPDRGETSPTPAPERAGGREAATITRGWNDFASRLASAWEWPAVLRGVFAALGLLVLLRYLGAAIGSTTGDRILDTGFAVWSVASQVIALAVGGAIAGASLKKADATDGMLAGLFTWAVATVIFSAVGGFGPLLQTRTSAAWGLLFGAALSIGAAMLGGLAGAKARRGAPPGVEPRA